MQSVNVLRDDSRAFSIADKFLDSAMAAVRFRYFIVLSVSILRRHVSRRISLESMKS